MVEMMHFTGGEIIPRRVLCPWRAHLLASTLPAVARATAGSPPPHNRLNSRDHKSSASKHQHATPPKSPPATRREATEHKLDQLIDHRRYSFDDLISKHSEATFR